MTIANETRATEIAVTDMTIEVECQKPRHDPCITYIGSTDGQIKESSIEGASGVPEVSRRGRVKIQQRDC